MTKNQMLREASAEYEKQFAEGQMLLDLAEKRIDELKALILGAYPDAKFEIFRLGPKDYRLNAAIDAKSFSRLDKALASRTWTSSLMTTSGLSSFHGGLRMATRSMFATEVERVMHEMPYGLYVIGSKEAEAGRVNGMMADWVMQISFEPRIVAVSFEVTSHTLQNIRERQYFSVNLLAQDDDSMELARRFAQPFSGEKVQDARVRAMKVHYKLDGLPTRRLRTAAQCWTRRWPGSSANWRTRSRSATTCWSSALC